MFKKFKINTTLFLNKIKTLFVKEQQLVNENNIEIETPQRKIKNIKQAKTSVINNNGSRFLKLENSDCALIMHDQNQCEVVFTKFDETNQNFTVNEELLMALTIFLKQPGFGDMLISEFHRVALNNSSEMFKDNTEGETE